MVVSIDDLVAAARTGNVTLLQQCTPADAAHIDINQYSYKKS